MVSSVEMLALVLEEEERLFIINYMEEKRKLSLMYRFLCAIGMKYSEEEYGQVTLGGVLAKFFGCYYHALLQDMMDWVIFAPIAARKVRPFLLRRMGAKVGKGCFIGDHVIFDLNHSDHIIMDDYAHIAGGCRLLCHQRNLTGYRKGDNYADFGYDIKTIHLCKGSLLGMTTMVMPGVTVGEGAMVAAGSFVNKDIPAWTVAVGRPAKPVKEIKERTVEEE